MATNLMKWSSLRDLSGLQDEVNELFRDFFRGSPGSAELGDGIWAPAVDIEETKEGCTVTADLPGMSQKDIRLNLESNALTFPGRKEVRED